MVAICLVVFDGSRFEVPIITADGAFVNFSATTVTVTNETRIGNNAVLFLPTPSQTTFKGLPRHKTQI